MRHIKTFVMLIACIVAVSSSARSGFAQSEPRQTHLVIRALANDAKLIGTKVGGAHIVVRDVTTGRILADGVQNGGTGDTGRIIVDPRRRHASVFDTEGAASYTATLELTEPTVVEITAYAPLGNPEATVQTSKQMLVIPGRDVLGEGIVLELNGFTVDWIAPALEAVHGKGDVLAVRVAVTMLCGCPTQPDGLWDSNSIDVVAQLMESGSVIDETPLEFAGETSTYEGYFTAPAPGDYFIRVLAMDDAHGNYGKAQRLITITP